MIANFFVSFLNLIIKALGSILNFIFSILPPSPFEVLDFSSVNEHLSTFNFFVPISQIVSVGEAWIVCISTYYLYQIVLRWIKAIK